MRHPIPVITTGLFALSLLFAGLTATAAPAAAATLAATTTCSNGVDNTGGLGVICEVTIRNTITTSGGSATVTVRECHGAAGNPSASCRTTVRHLTRPVTRVTQCNDAVNGGGSTLRCRVRVTNTFIGIRPGATGATSNQCVGSGDGITTGCDPFPATTSGATITQCNGSANGGTLVGLTCAATGTQSRAFSIRINQCNGSANGGGSLVICSAAITTVYRAAATTPSAGTDLPDTATAPASTRGTGATYLLLVIAFLGTLILVAPRARKAAPKV